MARPHIVLTGSAGRAGRAVLNDLLRHGYTVTAVDREVTPMPEGEFPGVLQDRVVPQDSVEYALSSVLGWGHPKPE